MDGDAQEGHRPNRVALIAGLGFFAVMAAFWILIWSGFFTHPNPDMLRDRSWVEAAGRICAPAANEIRALPNASDVRTPAERSELLDRGTTVLERMVDALAALPTPSDEDDRTIVRGFLDDWRVYISDRHAFADALLVDPKAEPLMSDVHGSPVGDPIDLMANINGIPECATPGDF